MIKSFEKIFNGKITLILVIVLFSLNIWFNSYNSNFIGIRNGEFLFYEAFIMCVSTFVISFIIYLVLNILFKDRYMSILLVIISILAYSLSFELIFSFTCLIFFAVLFLFLKNKFRINFKIVVLFFTFMNMFMFIPTLFKTAYYLYYTNTKSSSFDNKINVKVDSNEDVPNIYWIHADTMIGFDAMRKHFNYDNEELKKYFDSNGYLYNENARIIGGFGTKRALVALFNPYYYDNFYKDYFEDLVNVSLEKKQMTDKLVNHYELEEKRLNNELFNALKNKYTTYGIGTFDPYLSLFSDYYYDYYCNDNLFLYELDKNKDKYNDYIKMIHFEYELIRFGIISKPKICETNFLKKEMLDYKNNNIEKYPNSNKSKYVPIKKIFASLNDVNKKSQDDKFVFVDFFIVHHPFDYDENGNLINNSKSINLESFLGNYKYSVKLLIDVLDYIKQNDKNGVIIIQADHGLHVGSNEDLMSTFNISKEEVSDIRYSVMNAVYIPDKYKTSDIEVVKNPLNISRYLVNNYVGNNNYNYLK